MRWEEVLHSKNHAGMGVVVGWSGVGAVPLYSSVIHKHSFSCGFLGPSRKPADVLPVGKVAKPFLPSSVVKEDMLVV